MNESETFANQRENFHIFQNLHKAREKVQIYSRVINHRNIEKTHIFQ